MRGYVAKQRDARELRCPLAMTASAYPVMPMSQSRRPGDRSLRRQTPRSVAERRLSQAIEDGHRVRVELHRACRDVFGQMVEV